MVVGEKKVLDIMKKQNHTRRLPIWIFLSQPDPETQSIENQSIEKRQNWFENQTSMYSLKQYIN